MKKSNLFAVLALAATPAFLHAQATNFSDVVGYNKFNFPAGNSVHSATFVKGDVFKGVATSKSSNSISVSTANFGSLGPSDGLPTHYVKITSGVRQGYVFDILSNNTTNVTVDGSLSSVEATPSFVIRPHIKASDLFKTSTGLSPGLDTVTVFNDDGSSRVLLWASTDSATGFIDAVTESQVDAVIYPGQGFILTTVGSGNYTFQGSVETTPTVIPLFTGAVNLVARGNPSASNVSLQSIKLGENMALGLDSAEFWSKDGSLTSTGVFLWGGADGFFDAVTEAQATRSVEGNEVINVTVVSPTIWKVDAPYTP